MLDTLTRAELEAIASEPFEQRGIPHSEMALLIHTARKLGVEVLLESGRARGQSTYLLAKYLPNVRLISVECEAEDHPDEVFARERLKGFANVELFNGDGAQYLIGFAAQVRPKPTAVLCDGPKGINAIAVAKLCLRFNYVKAAFVHDMRRGEYRTIAEAVLPSPSFSDDPDFVSAYSWMDTNSAAINACGEKFKSVFGCYGPTLGVFLNNK